MQRCAPRAKGAFLVRQSAPMFLHPLLALFRTRSRHRRAFGPCLCQPRPCLIRYPGQVSAAAASQGLCQGRRLQHDVPGKGGAGFSRRSRSGVRIWKRSPQFAEMEGPHLPVIVPNACLPAPCCRVAGRLEESSRYVHVNKQLALFVLSAAVAGKSGRRRLTTMPGSLLSWGLPLHGAHFVSRRDFVAKLIAPRFFAGTALPNV